MERLIIVGKQLNIELKKNRFKSGKKRRQEREKEKHP